MVCHLRASRLLLVAALLLCLGDRPVSAAIRSWTNRNGGDYSLLDNWDGPVPTIADTALFITTALAGNNGVYLTTNSAAGVLTYDQVDLNLRGFNFSSGTLGATNGSVLHL